MRYIGLDVGGRRIGVALSDPLGVTAQPHETIENDDDALDRIARLASETDARRIIVGLPLLLDGTEGEQAGITREFAERLAERSRVEVEMVDERLTTRQAEAVLAGGGAGRSGGKGASDRIAAALILQSYLDGARNR